LLNQEVRQAENVKCRANRHLILSAISSCQHLLSQYKENPPNGLIIFSGGEENYRFVLEPPLPIIQNTYLCDRRFHVELVTHLFELHETIAYIVVHGDDALFATVTGTDVTLLNTTQGHLQNDTRRGGQSAPRFGRIAEGKRENYAKRICERANDLFGPLSGRTVHRIVLGGPADIKSRVQGMWNLELQPIVKTVSRGGEEGLRECMEKAQHDLNGLRIQEDLDLLGEFYKHLHRAPDTIIVGNEILELYHQGLIKAIWTTDENDERLQNFQRNEQEQQGQGQQEQEQEQRAVHQHHQHQRNQRQEHQEHQEYRALHQTQKQTGILLGYGTTLFVISATTDLGARFQREFNGLAAVAWVPSQVE